MSRVRSKERLFLLLILIASILIGLVAPNLLDKIRRSLYGVPPGVMLEGYAVGGLLRDEVELLLEKIAQQLEKPAVNAQYNAVERRVVPETVGQVLNRERTLEAVFSARRGQKVQAVLEPVHPPITHVYFQPVFRGDISRQAMALMINVAWGNEFIPGMLEVLAKYQVKATFFFIGEWVERFPSLFGQIVKAGHEIANHGYYHGHPNQMSEAELTDLISKAQTALEKAGATPVRLFAPPAGEYNQQVVRVAAGLGYRTVLWTVDTIDWQRPAPEVIIERVVKKAQNGALVLMHPTEPTLAALPRIIEILRQQGYELVPVSELL
ncbi:MAG: polysaccharide deacetylase family protein [Firmicutes bacterium]|nr:polysaccharide deacetylase family protein [Bacillota bacterium]